MNAAINPSDVIKAEKSAGGGICVICNLAVSNGDRVIAVEVTVGASFIKALQKKLRKEIHIHCAELVHSVLGQRIAEARK